MRNPWPGKSAITLREFGECASLSQKVVRRLIRTGQLRATLFGREYRIPRAEAFRILQMEDPEGRGPVPTRPTRRPLASDEEQILQEFLHRS